MHIIRRTNDKILHYHVYHYHIPLGFFIFHIKFLKTMIYNN